MADFDDKIYHYIDARRKAGQSFGEIREGMQKAGYPADAINRAFTAYKARQDFFSKNKAMIYGLVFVVLVIITIISVLLFWTNECSTRQCLINAADECKAASFIQTEGTATIRYSVNDECTLVKQVIGLDDTEPQEVRDLFNNQKMTCPYQRGNFDITLIDSFSRNIEQCDGTLKDILLQIRSLS